MTFPGCSAVRILVFHVTVHLALGDRIDLVQRADKAEQHEMNAQNIGRVQGEQQFNLQNLGKVQEEQRQASLQSTWKTVSFHVDSASLSAEKGGNKQMTPAPVDEWKRVNTGECRKWCADDYNSGKNQGRHCAPGNMAYKCGGCSFCGLTTTASGVGAQAGENVNLQAETLVGECKSWCEDDYISGQNQGRHCAPGDMAYKCGGCRFCMPTTTASGVEEKADSLYLKEDENVYLRIFSVQGMKDAVEAFTRQGCFSVDVFRGNNLCHRAMPLWNLVAVPVAGLCCCFVGCCVFRSELPEPPASA